MLVVVCGFIVALCQSSVALPHGTIPGGWQEESRTDDDVLDMASRAADSLLNAINPDYVEGCSTALFQLLHAYTKPSLEDKLWAFDFSVEEKCPDAVVARQYDRRTFDCSDIEFTEHDQHITLSTSPTHVRNRCLDRDHHDIPLAGGWSEVDANDQKAKNAADKFAEQLIGQLTTSSARDKNIACIVSVKALKMVERQVVAGTNWRLTTEVNVDCDGDVETRTCRGVEVYEGFSGDFEVDVDKAIEKCS